MTDRSTIPYAPSEFTSPLAAEIDCIGKMVVALEERLKVLEDASPVEHEFSSEFLTAEEDLLDYAAKLRAQADEIHRDVAVYRAAVIAAARATS